MSTDKENLRRAFLEKREALSPEFCRQASEQICAHLLAHPVVTGAQVIAGYWPVRHEVDIRPVLAGLAGQGIVTALPVVVPQSRVLSFFGWRGGEALKSSAFGISEPAERQTAVIPDVLLVPLVAFDKAGYRIGYGAGYYDSTLAELRNKTDRLVIAIGVAYAQQRCEAISAEPQDIKLDWLVTEQGMQELKGRK